MSATEPAISAKEIELVVCRDGDRWCIACGSSRHRCSVGRNGVISGNDKKEGDGCTPAGTFRFRRLFYRADRLQSHHDLFAKLSDRIPCRALTANDGWCDAPDAASYNHWVDLSRFDTSISHEKLWRDDADYDVILVLGYNDDPVVPGKGSAIFMHVSTADFKGTAGCVALPLPLQDLLQILPLISDHSTVTIHE